MSKFVETRTLVDQETGEVLSKKTAIRTFEVQQVEPSFIKLYLEDISYLYNIPKKSSDILFRLIKEINYQGHIHVNSFLKKQIADDLNIKNVNSVSNAISSYTKKGIMQNVGRATYMLNPNLFAKGNWEDIKKLRSEWLELRIGYTEEGKRIVNDKVVEA